MNRQGKLALVLMLASTAAWARSTFDVVAQDGHSKALSVADLEALEPQVVTVPDPHAGTPVRYRGVLLTRVLSLAGVNFDGPVRGPLLSANVVVEAADGYRVSFSVPEID